MVVVPGEVQRVQQLRHVRTVNWNEVNLQQRRKKLPLPQLRERPDHTAADGPGRSLRSRRRGEVGLRSRRKSGRSSGGHPDSALFRARLKAAGDELLRSRSPAPRRVRPAPQRKPGASGPLPLSRRHHAAARVHPETAPQNQPPHGGHRALRRDSPVPGSRHPSGQGNRSHRTESGSLESPGSPPAAPLRSRPSSYDPAPSHGCPATGLQSLAPLQRRITKDNGVSHEGLFRAVNFTCPQALRLGGCWSPCADRELREEKSPGGEGFGQD